MSKGKYRKFYKSAEWRRKRQQILQRDNNECQRCKEQGKFSIAEVVHHIKHLKDRWDLRLTDDNLISCCSACHNELHPEKGFQANQQKNKKPITPERW